VNYATLGTIGCTRFAAYPQLLELVTAPFMRKLKAYRIVKKLLQR
jgi:hypothetical protein